MSDEFISFKLLVVSGGAQVAALWRQAARQASMPVEFVDASGAQAAVKLAQTDFDFVVVDGALGSAECAAVAAEARRRIPAPYVAIAAIGSVVTEDADEIIDAPGDLKSARASIERLIRQRVPSRVLVVDDSSTMRTIVRKILSASRYAFNISEAANGHQAITAINSGEIDIVILDYNMPEFDGLEILRTIKKMRDDIGVVMMTAAVDEHLSRSAIAAGAAGFLKKPFYPADLDEVLSRHFTRPAGA